MRVGDWTTQPLQHSSRDWFETTKHIQNCHRLTRPQFCFQSTEQTKNTVDGLGK